MADDWLDKLKVGNAVIVGGSGSSAGTAAMVARLTSCQIIIANGDRFRKKDGRQVGGGPYGEKLNQPTQERWNRIKQRRLCFKLLRFNWGKLPLDVLVKVDQLLLENVTL